MDQFVQFDGINEHYSFDNPLRVRYTRSPNYIPTPDDWVGIFRSDKDGVKDFFTYEYAPCPPSGVPGIDVTTVIVFQNKNLPRDDEQLYQLRYISARKQILGVSDNFKFVDLVIEELIENQYAGESFFELNDVEDEKMIFNKMAEQEPTQSEILRISPLEDEIKALNEENLKLTECLNKETKKSESLEKVLSSLKHTNSKLIENIEFSNIRIAKLKHLDEIKEKKMYSDETEILKSAMMITNLSDEIENLKKYKILYDLEKERVKKLEQDILLLKVNDKLFQQQQKEREQTKLEIKAKIKDSFDRHKLDILNIIKRHNEIMKTSIDADQ